MTPTPARVASRSGSAGSPTRPRPTGPWPRQRWRRRSRSSPTVPGRRPSPVTTEPAPASAPALAAAPGVPTALRTRTRTVPAAGFSSRVGPGLVVASSGCCQGSTSVGHVVSSTSTSQVPTVAARFVAGLLAALIAVVVLLGSGWSVHPARCQPGCGDRPAALVNIRGHDDSPVTCLQDARCGGGAATGHGAGIPLGLLMAPGMGVLVLLSPLVRHVAVRSGRLHSQELASGLFRPPRLAFA